MAPSILTISMGLVRVSAYPLLVGSQFLTPARPISEINICEYRQAFARSAFRQARRSHARLPSEQTGAVQEPGSLRHQRCLGLPGGARTVRRDRARRPV